jgi:integrase
MTTSMDISGGSVLKVKFRPKPWRYVFRFNNKCITKSGFSSRKEALDAMQVKKEEILRLGGELKITSFNYAYNLYIEDMKNINTHGCVSNKITYGKRYEDFFGDVELHRITEFDIQKYKVKRKKSNTHSEQTLDHEIAVLKNFFNWSKKHGYISNNPASAVKKYNPDNRRGIVISNEEAKRLILSADNELRIRLLLALAYGIRSGEISNIKWTDIDFTNNSVTIFRLKKRRVDKAQLQVPEDILNLIKELPKSDGKRSDYIFQHQHCEKSFKNAKKLAGLDASVRFHDLRHTAASWQLSSGANIEAIRLFLGHADISTTMRYLHIDDKQIQNMAQETLKALM